VDKSSSLSPDDVSTLIDHLLKSKDPATVGLRKILKGKRDAAEDFPLHPLSFEEFHAPGKTREAFSNDEKRMMELEKKVSGLESRIEELQKQSKAAVISAHARGLAEGRAAGEADGRAKASAAFDAQVRGLQEKIAFFLSSLEASKKKIYTDAHTVLLRLCFELTKKIINTECATNPDVVLSVIRKSLSYISDREKLIVRVCKDDLENASSKKDFWLPVGERVESIRIESDERIEKGGCIIESNSGVADARLGVQMQELTEFVEKIWAGASSPGASASSGIPEA
jgi:flagellar biosynthesis/type III secretory pathway protein FliH